MSSLSSQDKVTEPLAEETSMAMDELYPASDDQGKQGGGVGATEARR